MHFLLIQITISIVKLKNKFPTYSQNTIYVAYKLPLFTWSQKYFSIKKELSEFLNWMGSTFYIRLIASQEKTIFCLFWLLPKLFKKIAWILGHRITAIQTQFEKAYLSYTTVVDWFAFYKRLCNVEESIVYQNSPIKY